MSLVPRLLMFARFSRRSMRTTPGSEPGQAVFAHAAGPGQRGSRTRPRPALPGLRPGGQPGSAVLAGAGPAAVLTADGEVPADGARCAQWMGFPRNTVTEDPRLLVTVRSHPPTGQG